MPFVFSLCTGTHFWSLTTKIKKNEKKLLFFYNDRTLGGGPLKTKYDDTKNITCFSSAASHMVIAACRKKILIYSFAGIVCM